MRANEDETSSGASIESELVSEAMVMAEESLDATTIIRYCCECATVLGVISFVVFQQGDELKNQGLASFLKQLKQAPAKAIFLVSNLLILVCRKRVCVLIHILYCCRLSA